MEKTGKQKCIVEEGGAKRDKVMGEKKRRGT